MANYSELMITVSKLAESSYGIELRFSATRFDPVSHREEQIDLIEHGEGNFDFKALDQALTEERLQDYGVLLYQSLVGAPALAKAYQEALTISKSNGLSTRLRLYIDRSAPELHNQCWEVIHLPGPEPGTQEYDEWKDNPNFLTWDQNLLFSRYLYSSRYTPVEQRSKGELRALVVVANPKELDRPQGLKVRLTRDVVTNLSRVRADDEVRRAQEALSGIKVDVLASGQNGNENVSMEKLSSRLRKGCDILYLVCHGAMVADDLEKPDSLRRPYLLLEDDEGSAKLVHGMELVGAISNLQPGKRPRLVVLASCQSAGKGVLDDPYHSSDGGVLAALGPRLAEVGVPAVVAMQTDVFQDSVAQFMPVFFHELLVDGQVDRAMAAARYAIKDRDDWWAPVLSLRLREGLWYEPYFTGGEGDYTDLWDDVVSNINYGNCVPILGFGMLEFLLGTSRDLARDLARTYRYPLDLLSLENFAQVAQYLATNYGAGGSRDRIIGHITQRLRENYGNILQEDTSNWKLDQLLWHIRAMRQETEPVEAYQILAALPFEIYFTTNHDSLLEHALEAQDPPRHPQVMYSRWNRKLISGELLRSKDKKLVLSSENPVVYHLLGLLEEPRSMVLSEDDYFDFMMWVNNKSAQVPIQVDLVRAWREKSLLFLGYRLSDWSFRVLYRSILNDERRYGRDYKSVAVQLHPSEENLRPESARKFLEKYFPNDNFNIYWGGSDEFLKDLWARWSVRGKTA